MRRALLCPGVSRRCPPSPPPSPPSSASAGSGCRAGRSARARSPPAAPSGCSTPSRASTRPRWAGTPRSRRASTSCRTSGTWRTRPARESLREVRFPHVTVAGPIRSYPGVVGSASPTTPAATSRWPRADTILLRDVLVPVSDTLSSRGGLSDLRFAGAYRFGDAWICRRRLPRHHRLQPAAVPPRPSRDTTYQAATETHRAVLRRASACRSAWSGISAPAFSVAASVRSDGKVNVDRDSARVSHGGPAVHVRARAAVARAAQAGARQRGASRQDLVGSQQRSPGPGRHRLGEHRRGLARRRSSRRTLAGRPGVRSGSAPATARCRSRLVEGEQPHELGVSLGTGRPLRPGARRHRPRPGARVAVGGRTTASGPSWSTSG